MNKNLIKIYLNKTFVNEASVPGLEIVKKVKKQNDKINKDTIKASSDQTKKYGTPKETKEQEKTSKTNKFNFVNDKAKNYHDEVEIRNGQEMIEYSSEPSERFKERALEAIVGSSNMGNNPEWANVYDEQKGFTGPKFGEKLAKTIKSTKKKRDDSEPNIVSFGDDIEFDTKKKEKRKIAIKEGKKDELGKTYTHFAIFKDSNKIATGWDYKSLYDKSSKTYDNESIKEYAKGDLIEMFPEMKASEFKIVKREFLIKNGVEPSDINNWYKPQETINENQINKDKMKRLRFKTEFNGFGNALKLIPESYKIDDKTFEMTDGNETYKIRWEGDSKNGKGVILMANDKSLMNEDIKRMKQLMGYKSIETLGNVKGKERINENKTFSNLLEKSKKLMNESDDIEDCDPEEAYFDEANIGHAPEAKKHVQGTVSKDKGTQAPTPKTGLWDKETKTHAPEAKKHVKGSTTQSKDGVAPKPKTGLWDKETKTHAPEAKKHVKENIESWEGTMDDFQDPSDNEYRMEKMSSPNSEPSDYTHSFGDEDDFPFGHEPSNDDELSADYSGLSEMSDETVFEITMDEELDIDSLHEIDLDEWSVEGGGFPVSRPGINDTDFPEDEKSDVNYEKQTKDKNISMADKIKNYFNK